MLGNNLYAMIPIVVNSGAPAIRSTGAAQRKLTTVSTKVKRRKEEDIPK